jgi:hypothetical protein
MIHSIRNTISTNPSTPPRPLEAISPMTIIAAASAHQEEEQLAPALKKPHR